MSRVALYRHFAADGELLYVGVSVSAPTRLCEHTRSTWFHDIVKVTIEWLPDRKAATEAEMLAIRTERPKHNVQFSDSDPTRNRPRGWWGAKKVSPKPSRPAFSPDVMSDGARLVARMDRLSRDIAAASHDRNALIDEYRSERARESGPSLSTRIESQISEWRARQTIPGINA